MEQVTMFLEKPLFSIAGMEIPMYLLCLAVAVLLIIIFIIALAATNAKLKKTKKALKQANAEIKSYKDAQAAQESAQADSTASDSTSNNAVAAEPVSEPVAQPVEEAPVAPVEETVEEEPVQAVAAEEVGNMMSDEQAQLSVEKGTRYADKTKTSIINVDTLSKYFNAGETVTLDEIKKRIPGYKKVTYIKVLARGIIDKPLTVEADEYSLDAVKMIVLTGGTVIRMLKK